MKVGASHPTKTLSVEVEFDSASLHVPVAESNASTRRRMAKLAQQRSGMSGERSLYIAESPKQQGLGPLADRLRNSRTVAGFVSKPCETATTNKAETLSTERVTS